MSTKSKRKSRKKKDTSTSIHLLRIDDDFDPTKEIIAVEPLLQSNPLASNNKTDEGNNEETRDKTANDEETNEMLTISSFVPPLNKSVDPLFANHQGSTKLLLPLGVIPFHGCEDVPGAKEFLIHRAEEALEQEVSNQAQRLMKLPTKTPAKSSMLQAKSFYSDFGLSSPLSRPSTASNALLLPRLEPQESNYLKRPSTTALSEHRRSKSVSGTTRSLKKYSNRKTKNDKTRTNKNIRNDRRPNTAPNHSKRGKRHGSIGTRSGMLIDRPPPIMHRSTTKRPATSNGASRNRHGNESMDKMKNNIILKREDIERYKRMLKQDIFCPRSKMLSKRLDLTFLIRENNETKKTTNNIQNKNSSAPRLLSILYELIQLIHRSPNTSEQLISSGMVPLISSAAWLFGTYHKSIERNISETASELLLLFCQTKGMATHLNLYSGIVSTLGAIIVSGIGDRLNESSNEKEGEEEKEEKEEKEKEKEEKENLVTKEKGRDIAYYIRKTNKWKALRPYEQSFKDHYLPTDYKPSKIHTILHHTSRQVHLAISSLGSLSTITEQYYLRSGDGSGWRRFLECGGLEYLIIAGSDGSQPSDTLPIGKLNALCPSFLDTNQCIVNGNHHQTCNLMHVTGVYPTLTGVLSGGDLYKPYTVYPSASLERVRLAHTILQIQFNVKDFNEMRKIRRERVAITIENVNDISGNFITSTKVLSPSSTAKTLSVRASLLFDQLSADDPSAALSLTKFGSTHFQQIFSPSSPIMSPTEKIYQNLHDKSPEHTILLPSSTIEKLSPKEKEKLWIQRYNSVDGTNLEPKGDSTTIEDTKKRNEINMKNITDDTIRTQQLSPPSTTLSPIYKSPGGHGSRGGHGGGSRRHRDKGRDCESLLALHMENILVGNTKVQNIIKHTIRQHLEWLRRLDKKRKRLAIEAEEWKIIRQQRIVIQISKMMNFIRRAAQRDPHEERLVGEMLKVFAKSCIKFKLCNQRAHAEVMGRAIAGGKTKGRKQQQNSNNNNVRKSSRTDLPHCWLRATKKVPYSRCHYCGLLGKEEALESTVNKRNFLTATALGLRFRNWLSNVSIAFLRMNLPKFHQEWITNCQINNEKDCGIAGFRLSKHPWFVKYCGSMINEPKAMKCIHNTVEVIDIILVGSKSTATSMSGTKETQRKKMLSLPKGIDPSKYGWPGLSLQG